MPVMTVYVAKAGTPLATGGTSTAGHMWFSLNTDGSSPERSYGFAPISHEIPIGAGQVYTDDVSNFRIMITLNHFTLHKPNMIR